MRDISDEIPFEIPDSWEWVRLETICEYIQRGKSPKYSPIKKYPVIAQKCNQWSGFSIDKAQFIEPDSLKTYGEERLLQNDDLLWNSTGLGTLGRMAIYKSVLNPYELAVADSHVTVIRPFKQLALSEYLYFYFSNPTVQNTIEEKADGTTKQKELATNTIKNYPVPLPPLAEQVRILNLLHEVLPIILDYEHVEIEVRNLNETFPDRLKKSILQMAVQGKLVKQDPNDEPASVLLERIRVEKQRLVKEGKIKKDKHESVIYRRDNSHYEKLDGVERCIDDEIPFDIPESWEWVRVKELFNVVSARRVHQSDWRKEGVPFYRAREIGKLSENGVVNNELFIDEELYDRLSKSGVPSANDIMVTAVGTLGKTYVVKPTDRFYYKDASVICFENFSNTSPFYMKLAMQSPYMCEQIKECSAGTTVGTITIIKASDYLIPLPPRYEQERIVAAYHGVIEFINKLG